MFAALPTYFDWNDLELMRLFAKGMLIFTSVIYLVLNGVAYPIIEEIYFRGYLTNRLNRYGMLTPIHPGSFKTEPARSPRKTKG